jgi:phosphatidate cytidylyltransferase
MAAEGSGALRDFGVRTASALAVGAVLLVTLLFGGVWALAAVTALIAALATAELYALARRERRLPNELFGLVAVIALPFAAAAWGSDGVLPVLAWLVIASLGWHVAFRIVRLADTAVTVFGALYVGFGLAHLVLIRELPRGMAVALVMIIGIWANDVLAYVVGSAFGRHRLAPRISPKKSWEGLAAGTLGTLLAWVIGGAIADLGLAPGALAGIGLAASVASVTGDLAESRIKREAGVKDSGRLLPGHGGFLDRFDSFILVAVVTYYAVQIAGLA